MPMLPSQFGDSPNITAIMSAITAQMSAITADATAIRAIMIDAAAGDQLDLLGGHIGVSRIAGFETDAGYRKYLKAFGRTLNGMANGDELVDAISDLFGSALTYNISSPAIVQILLPDQSPSDDLLAAVRRILRRVLPVGVGWEFLLISDTTWLFDTAARGVNVGTLDGVITS